MNIIHIIWTFSSYLIDYSIRERLWPWYELLNGSVINWYPSKYHFKLRSLNTSEYWNTHIHTQWEGKKVIFIYRLRICFFFFIIIIQGNLQASGLETLSFFQYFRIPFPSHLPLSSLDPLHCLPKMGNSRGEKWQDEKKINNHYLLFPFQQNSKCVFVCFWCFWKVMIFFFLNKLHIYWVWLGSSFLTRYFSSFLYYMPAL